MIHTKYPSFFDTFTSKPARFDFRHCLVLISKNQSLMAEASALNLWCKNVITVPIRIMEAALGNMFEKSNVNSC